MEGLGVDMMLILKGSARRVVRTWNLLIAVVKLRVP